MNGFFTRRPDVRNEIAFGALDSACRCEDEGMNKSREGMLYFFSKIDCGFAPAAAASGVFSTLSAGVYFAGDVAEKYRKANLTGGVTDYPIINFNLPFGNVALDTNAVGTVASKLIDFAKKWVRCMEQEAQGMKNPSLMVQVREYFDQFGWHEIQDIIKTAAREITYFSVPFVKNGVHAVEDLAKAIDICTQKYRLDMSGRSVEVLGGVPAAIDGGINVAMNRLLTRSMADLGKSATGLAAEIAGLKLAKSIISLVISVVDAIGTTIWKMYDLAVIKAFCNQAQDYYAQINRPDSIHRYPQAFEEWMYRPCMNVPVLAALALRSGFAGDATMKTYLGGGSNGVISTESFERAATYFEKQKSVADAYIRKQDLSLFSHDELVNALMNRKISGFREARLPMVALAENIRSSMHSVGSSLRKSFRRSMRRLRH